MMKTRIKRITAALLAAAVLVMMLPSLVFPMTAAAADTRVADASSMDDWKDHFGKTVLHTTNAGGVWTDKSVFADADVFQGTGIELSGGNDSFLVALSAIASNISVSGMTNVPTDTMLVLDLSSSMYGGSQKNPATVQTMLGAVNHVIDELQTMNTHNRVGVVVYFGGGDYLPSGTGSAKVLLPLDRYTYAGNDADNTYLKATLSGGKLVSVDVAANVTASDGTVVSAKHTVANVAGTYTQLGILSGMDELLAAETKIPATAEYMAGQTRIPVMVLMSDGEPTAATANFTNKETAGMGNNTVSFRNPAQTDFVTQLTAAYAKEMIDEHYKDTDPLFYTLSLGTDISLDVMDPENNDRTSQAVLQDPQNHTDEQKTAAAVNRTIDGYWDLLLSDDAVNITVQNCKGQWDATKVDKTYTVSKTSVAVDGTVTEFPATKSQKYYVDEAFTADDAAGMVDAFDSIVHKIDLQSHYFPTLVEDNEELSGYISFVDKVGDHMSVTDIKGILIDNVLFSGAMLSRNFVTGGGDLGTFDDPKPLGDELVWAVQARLGVDAETARDLLGLAYSYGQIGYTSDTDFSNYIGWYANARQEFLGFWHDGVTTVPDPSDPSLTDETRPMYFIKSYGFLGAVDEEHGVVESDMMYATVQVRENIITGEETVVFAVPAALIPLVTYNVTLDKTGGLEALDITGADHPIRLVYEVALDDGIDEITVSSVVGDNYAHKNADGSYDFYTNQFETDNSVGYGKMNTYSYFVPSHQNGRYYYTEDAVVYTDMNGTLYTGEHPDANGRYYRAAEVYSSEGGNLTTKLVYEPISAVSLMKATEHDDGYWYIPAGTVHTMLEGFVTEKDPNATESLTYVNAPFVDTQYNYYVGATLGNNGRLTIIPATGIKLSKTIDNAAAETQAFEFIVDNVAADETAEYAAVLENADGTKTDTTVAFVDGTAQVTLKNGQTMYIVGMTAGAQYRISEKAHEEYKLHSVNGDTQLQSVSVTLETAKLAEAAFVNTLKGNGDVVIVKRVEHDLGTSYQLPDMSFAMCVDLGAAYAGATVKAEHSGDASVTSVTADENGSFTVSLKHSEQFELFGLKEGTLVTVTEIDPPDGFTPTYYGEGVKDQNVVTIRENASISVIVANRYQPRELTSVNVSVGGHKLLLGRENDQWIDTDVYTFELQKYDGAQWVTIATEQVDKDDSTFDFTDVMQSEVFASSGAYSYQIVETLGSVAGVTYDRSIHTFTVIVGDPDMTGLRVLDVVSYQAGDLVSGNETDGWTVTADFTNTYSTEGSAAVALDINKALINPSNSDLVSLAGFRFGLYELKDDGTADTLKFASAYTDMVGEARLVAEFDAIGTYRYLLKEIVPDTVIDGMVYSTEEYLVEVTVSDDDDGTISASYTVKQNGDPVNDIVFTNRYEPTAAKLIPTVIKGLVGRDLQDDEFTFLVKSGDTVLATGKNTADGTVVFDKELTFDKIGDYYYDVVEETGEAGGVTYDTAVYHLHISVTDGGDGALAAHYHIINAIGETVRFVNVYQPTPVELTLSGVKTLVGRALINEEFTFILVENDVENGLVLTAKNFADGTFAFEPIRYDTAGTYRYTVTEVQRSTAHGIVFDTSSYEVQVTVTDDGCGQLHLSYDILKGEQHVQAIAFENHYAPAPTAIAVDGVKTLEGRDLTAAEFSFRLATTDEKWIEVDTLQTVVNDADGRFVFEDLTIDSAGTYRYLVAEQNAGETIDGVTYDNAVYYLLVVVTDNGRGILVVERTLFDKDMNYAQQIAFRNVYTTTTTQPTTPTTESTTSTTESTTSTTESTTSTTESTTSTTESTTSTTESTTSTTESTTSTTESTTSTTESTTSTTESTTSTTESTTSTTESTTSTTGSTSLATVTTTTTKTTTPDSPKTGESGQMLLWLAVLMIGGGAFVAALVIGRQKQQDA